MKKLVSLTFGAVALSLSAPAAANVDAQEKDRLYDTNGAYVGKVDRVAKDGDVFVIVRSKYHRVDASTLSKDEGRITTSMTKKEIRRSK